MATFLMGASIYLGQVAAKDNTNLTLQQQRDVDALKSYNIGKALETVRGIRASPTRDLEMVRRMVAYHDKEFDLDTMTHSAPTALPK